jgi:hypothetical protein
MDNKNKIFLIVFFLLIVGSIGATYYRTMIKKDYLISAQTDCDPYTEKCFIWECDPASTVEGEACTGDLESDIWYYKIIQRKAFNIPLCDPNDENCEALVCPEGEKDCAEVLCSSETATEGEACNDPEEYTINNPEEEDAEECAEDDEECLAAEEETTECEEGDEECVADESEESEAEEDVSSSTSVFPTGETQTTADESAE